MLLHNILMWFRDETSFSCVTAAPGVSAFLWVCLWLMTIQDKITHIRLILLCIYCTYSISVCGLNSGAYVVRSGVLLLSDRLQDTQVIGRLNLGILWEIHISLLRPLYHPRVCLWEVLTAEPIWIIDDCDHSAPATNKDIFNETWYDIISKWPSVRDLWTWKRLGWWIVNEMFCVIYK